MEIRGQPVNSSLPCMSPSSRDTATGNISPVQIFNLSEGLHVVPILEVDRVEDLAVAEFQFFIETAKVVRKVHRGCLEKITTGIHT
jgi:hypothetical protein